MRVKVEDLEQRSKKINEASTTSQDSSDLDKQYEPQNN